MATKKDARPNKGFNDITQLGLKAHALATEHEAALAPRLTNAVLTSLAADLENLGALVPDAKNVRDEAKTATASQGAELTSGYGLVTAVRLAVARRAAPPEVQKAYGVGTKVGPGVVKDVRAAIKKILDRAKDKPTEPSGLGILQKDLDALSTALSAIESADAHQEKKRAVAPQSTKERNATARRILAAVDEIVAAGVLEFAQNATERARFEALIGMGNRKKKPS